MQRQAVCGSAARQWAQRTEAEAARLRLLIPTCEVTTASRFKSGPSAVHKITNGQPRGGIG
jgi:hypothetical protein